MPFPSYSTIPSDDDEFRSKVKKLAEQAEDVDRLRELIATLYPNAHVSIQEPLGSITGEPMIVYIYRDGHRRDGATDGQEWGDS